MWDTLLDFIAIYQTLIGSILIISVGFLGYRQTRKLKKNEQYDIAFSAAILIQARIENIIYRYLGAAQSLKNLRGYSKVKKPNSKDFAGAFQIEKYRLKKYLNDPFFENDKLLKELNFFGADVIYVSVFYAKHRNLLQVYDDWRFDYGDDKVFKKHVHQDIDIFANNIFRTTNTAMRALKLLMAITDMINFLVIEQYEKIFEILEKDPSNKILSVADFPKETYEEFLKLNDLEGPEETP